MSHAPYYQDEAVTLYHADCLDVLPTLGRFDLLLTDPPYGIREAAGKNASRGKLAVSRDYGNESWDDSVQQDRIDLARSLSRWHVVFGGNYYTLPPSSCWLVWDKDNNSNDFADCELAWTNLKKAVRRLVYRWNGMLQQPGRPKEQREHPTQKPEPVMVWALSQAPQDVKTVLDPFAGSGTTGVAAKRLGRKCVLIEREEKYCEIAARRLSQGALNLFGDGDAA